MIHQFAAPHEEILPPELTDDEFLAQAEGQIRGYGKLVVSGIVEIGRKLVEVKDRVGHGRYTGFVTDRLGWSEASGKRFVAVYEMMSRTLNLSDFDGLTIDASSLYRIAAPSTPAEVRDRVLEKAATPEGISRQEVEQMVQAARDEAIAAVHAEYDGRLSLTEADLEAELSKIAARYERQIDQLQQKQEKLVDERDRARANAQAAQAKTKGRADPPRLNFDSNTSFRAMCIIQAVAALAAELKIRPQQLIDIERQMATQIHQQPELADKKLATLGQHAKAAVAWLNELVGLLGEEAR